MNCRDTEQRLSNNLEDRLGRHETGSVRAHLQQCPACRRRREEILAAEASLRALPELPLPDGARSRVIDRWLAERRPPLADWRSRWPVPAHPASLAAMAAAALLLAALGFSLTRWTAAIRSRSSGSSVIVIAPGSVRPSSQTT